MKTLSRISEWISKFCQFIGGLSLVCTILVTMTDVVTRYLFKITEGSFGFVVKGSVELVSYLMLFALLSAFAGFIERSQIIVDVFTQKLNYTIKVYLMGFCMLIFTIVAGFFVAGFYELMHNAMKFGNVTQDLRISMVPIYAFSGFLCVLLVIRSLIESIGIFHKKTFHNAEEAS